MFGAGIGLIVIRLNAELANPCVRYVVGKRGKAFGSKPNLARCLFQVVNVSVKAHSLFNTCVFKELTHFGQLWAIKILYQMKGLY